MDTADHLRDASPWRAEPDPVKLAILGKLAEETGELQAAIARCIIQGVDGVHPVTRKPNVEWLQEEIADVLNMLEFCDRLFDATDEIINQGRMRRVKKRMHIDQWLDSFKEKA